MNQSATSRLSTTNGTPPEASSFTIPGVMSKTYLTSRAGSYYWQPYQSATFTYTNNRRNGWSYDADGRISYTPLSTNDGARNLWYDAAGRLVKNTIASGAGSSSTTATYIPACDGDGRLAYEWAQTTGIGYSYPPTTSYILRSTVLGGEVLTRLDQNGNKSITYVPAKGLLFATQTMGGGPSVTWTQRNPLGITETGLGVYDPLGNYVPFQRQQDPRPPAGSYNSSSMSGLAASLGNTNDYGGMGCLMDGLPTSCDRVLQTINHEGAKGVIISGTQNPLVVLANQGVIFQTSKQIVSVPPDPDPGPEVDPELNGLADVEAVDYVSLGPGGQRGFGQNPQNPFPTFSKDDLKTVNDSIKLAKEITDPKKHKNCDEALKAYGIPSLAALINGMTANGNVFDGRTSTLTGPIGKNGATESMAAYFKENKTSVGAAVFNNSVTGRGSVTFLGDYFFNPASMDWVAFQRAIIILHESVHQVGQKGEVPFGSSKELQRKSSRSAIRY